MNALTTKFDSATPAFRAGPKEIIYTLADDSMEGAMASNSCYFPRGALLHVELVATPENGQVGIWKTCGVTRIGTYAEADQTITPANALWPLIDVSKAVFVGAIVGFSVVTDAGRHARD